VTDPMIEELLRQTADRVEADPALSERLRGRVRRVRRARRRRRAAAAGAAAVVLGAAVVGGLSRHWTDDASQDPTAVVATQPTASAGVSGWRLRTAPVPDAAAAGDDLGMFAVGQSAVALGYRDGHYVASVAATAGEPFGSARPSSPARLTSAVTAVSDTTLYLWGGQDTARGTPLAGPVYPPSGLAFDVATQTWSVLPAAPIESRDGAVAVWTGDRLIIWGGLLGEVPSTGTPARVRSDGAAYAPATRTWELLPAAPGDGNLVPQHAVWSGGRMIVWARERGESSALEGGRTLVLDVAGRTWTEAAGPTLDAAGSSLVLTSAGPVAVSVLFGQSHAARFDRATSSWSALPGPTVPSATICPTSVVALLAPAAATAVAVPECAGGTPQLLDAAAGAWVPLTRWGTGLSGIASAGESFLLLWKPPGRAAPDAAASLQVLSPS